MGNPSRPQRRRPRQTSYLQKPKPDPTLFERRLNQEGYHHIAGVDEAGRGCLAGPVVAAAVILPGGLIIEGLKDSKKLTPKKRDELYDVVRGKAIAWSWHAVDATRIDEINILQATLVAMKESVQKLSTSPDYILIDGINCIAHHLPQRAIKKGDGLSHSIAAASVIAKVTRDRLMCDHTKTYPQFSFDVHKGYGTALHLEEIRSHGATPLHRMTFAGVCDR